MKRILLTLGCLVFSSVAFAQNATWIASASGLATTSAYTMSIEAGTLRSVQISKICIGTSSATSAAAVTVTIQRRSTASSGGTAATSEGTGAAAVSAVDIGGDGIFPGTVRITATLGTAGAVLDQWGFTVGEIGSTDDPPSQPIYCKSYGDNGDKKLTIPQGTANGISISVSAAGSGGLASGAISATLLGQAQ